MRVWLRARRAFQSYQPGQVFDVATPIEAVRLIASGQAVLAKAPASTAAAEETPAAPSVPRRGRQRRAPVVIDEAHEFKSAATHEAMRQAPIDHTIEDGVAVTIPGPDEPLVPTEAD